CRDDCLPDTGSINASKQSATTGNRAENAQGNLRLIYMNFMKEIFLILTRPARIKIINYGLSRAGKCPGDVV
ncbi:hypothetical protein NL519_39075, partial [Klebsiella pneumoniae]|nr:hypothetical protein [Klebsiella pneumoniae]